MPAKAHPLHPRRSWFAPAETRHSRVGLGGGAGHAPGPKSLLRWPFITIAGRAGTDEYRASHTPWKPGAAGFRVAQRPPSIEAAAGWQPAPGSWSVSVEAGSRSSPLSLMEHDLHRANSAATSSDHALQCGADTGGDLGDAPMMELIVSIVLLVRRHAGHARERVSWRQDIVYIRADRPAAIRSPATLSTASSPTTSRTPIRPSSTSRPRSACR